MADQQLANLAQSTLSSSYASGDTTLHLVDGSSFPSSGDFIVAMDDPPTFLLKCTARSGNDLTVTSSGQEGTSAANKASGTKVTHVVSAGVMRALYTDYLRSDLIANIPAAARAGRIFVPTDSLFDLVRDTGSAWEYFRNGRKMQGPLSAMAWANQGSCTLTTLANGAERIKAPAGGTNVFRCRLKAPANSHFTWTCAIAMTPAVSLGGAPLAGICVTDGTSGTSKLIFFGFFTNGRIYLSKWSINNGFTADYLGSTALYTGYTAPFIYLRVVEDASHRTWYFSMTGEEDDFQQVLQTGNTDYLTTTNIGFAAFDAASSLAYNVTAAHMGES